MKRVLLALAIFTSVLGYSKETCLQVLEANYSEDQISILSIHEILLVDKKGNDYTIEDKQTVRAILAKHAGVSSIGSDYQFNATSKNPNEISVCLNLKNQRALSSKEIEDDLLVDIYKGIEILNPEVISIKINKRS